MALPTLADNIGLAIKAVKYAKGDNRLAQNTIIGTVPSANVGTEVLGAQVTLTANMWADGPKIVDLPAGSYFIAAQGLIYRNNASGCVAYLRLRNETLGADMAGTSHQTINGVVATPHVFSSLNISGFFTLEATANVVLQGAISTANGVFRANSSANNNIPNATQISWFKVGP